MRSRGVLLLVHREERPRTFELFREPTSPTVGLVVIELRGRVYRPSCPSAHTVTNRQSPSPFATSFAGWELRTLSTNPRYLLRDRPSIVPEDGGPVPQGPTVGFDRGTDLRTKLAFRFEIFMLLELLCR